MSNKSLYTIADIPEDEDERLEKLHEYQILDTLPEPEYDDLTSLASHICGTPIALVTLIDAERQWFKSARGTEVKETPRDISFCAHAITISEPMIVPNTLDDPRFRHNPLVTGETQVRFYAGFQLYAEGGHALGTICALDNQPRELSGKQLDAMKALARQAASLLELRLQRNRAIERNAALARALDAKEKANRSRELFTYALSHELRTPLNAIIGYAELIEEDDEIPPDSASREDLESLQIAARHLLELIKDILLLGDIERTEFDVELIDHTFSALVDELKATIGPSIIERGHDFEVHIDPALPDHIRIDANKVRHVLINLLAQSCLRARDGGLKLSIAYANERRDRVMFEVSDHGTQLSEEQLAVIFEPFSQKRRLEASGLALVIAKRITRVLGGKLTAESTAEKTRFTLELAIDG